MAGQRSPRSRSGEELYLKTGFVGGTGRREEESPRTYGEDQAQFQIFGSPFQKLQLNNTENCPLRCRLKGLKISAFLHEVWCEELWAKNCPFVPTSFDVTSFTLFEGESLILLVWNGQVWLKVRPEGKESETDDGRESAGAYCCDSCKYSCCVKAAPAVVMETIPSVRDPSDPKYKLSPNQVWKPRLVSGG